jgi:predicted amidohydrolase YtcJ
MRPSLLFLASLLLIAALTLLPAIPPSDLVITRVTVINPGDAKPQPDMTIITRGHDIVLVTKTNDAELSSSAKVIDAHGKFAIPGLWDMHMHFRDPNRDLKLDIANGVLGIRNMGGAIKEVFPLA